MNLNPPTLSIALLGVEQLMLPDPLSFDWWTSRPTWLAVVAFAVIAAVRMTERFEPIRTATARSADSWMLTIATLLGVAAVGILFVVGSTPATALASVVMLAIRMSRGVSSREFRSVKISDR